MAEAGGTRTVVITGKWLQGSVNDAGYACLYIHIFNILNA